MVITVPAYFNDGQRQATKDAGRLAGLEVVRLVNEPTAASLAYGLGKMAEGNVAVYDFGGGTFDISILSIKGGIFEVLATNGDTHLGGDDIDAAIVDWMLAELPEQLRCDRHVWNSARHVAEEAKKRLTDSERTAITLDLPGHRVEKELTRARAGIDRGAAGRTNYRAMRARAARRKARALDYRRGRCWSAARPGCRWCGGGSPKRSAVSRCARSIPTRWSRWAPRCRPAC